MAERTDQNSHTVIMIGAGPAALSAAIYTTREDIETLLLEKAIPGGMAAITDIIDNYPGFPKGVAGTELAISLQQQAERFGAVIEPAEVLGLHDEGEWKRLETTDGDLYARAVLVATGSDYKNLASPARLSTMPVVCTTAQHATEHLPRQTYRGCGWRQLCRPGGDFSHTVYDAYRLDGTQQTTCQ